MRRSGILRAAAVLAALAVPAGAGTSHVIEGNAAQALRCAAYIVMAGQYGYAEGRLTTRDRAVMANWSASVISAHVAPAARLAAYGAALTELDTEPRTRDLIARHGEWCLRVFTPGL